MAATPKDLEAVLCAGARAIGFSHASYVCGGAPGIAARMLLTDYPQGWREHFNARGYGRIDPILARARRSLRPFLWRDPLVRADMSPRQLRIQDEASEYGLGHGYAVPLHASLDVRTACFFASAHGDIDPAACAIACRLSVLVHEHACRLARFAAGASEPPRFSERERACLYLFGLGMGDTDIANALGLSIATVRRHFAQARKRCRVGSRQEALLMAVASGQVDAR